MLGESVTETRINGRGIVGDRVFAVRDRETGLIASAKHPRRWRRLLACRAWFVESPRPGEPLPPVGIALPDGSRTRSDAADVDRRLSAVLGREVELVAVTEAPPEREADRSPIESTGSGKVVRREPMNLAAPPGSFFDVASLHLISLAAMDRLAAAHPGGTVDQRRFRPNLVIGGLDEGDDQAELRWLGGEVRLGPEVVTRIVDPCPRCVVTTLSHGDVPADPGLLKALVATTRATSLTLAPGTEFVGIAGVYGTVESAGLVARDMEVTSG